MSRQVSEVGIRGKSPAVSIWAGTARSSNRQQSPHPGTQSASRVGTFRTARALDSPLQRQASMNSAADASRRASVISNRPTTLAQAMNVPPREMSPDLPSALPSALSFRHRTPAIQQSSTSAVGAAACGTTTPRHHNGIPTGPRAYTATGSTNVAPRHITKTVPTTPARSSDRDIHPSCKALMQMPPTRPSFSSTLRSENFELIEQDVQRTLRGGHYIFISSKDVPATRYLANNLRGISPFITDVRVDATGHYLIFNEHSSAGDSQLFYNSHNGKTRVIDGMPYVLNMTKRFSSGP